jgi:putative phosphoribosyl transferase
MSTSWRFTDRGDAGRRLAALLVPMVWQEPVVVALPRGGVPVAFEIADALHAPLDVVIARKVGAPEHPEFGVGAVAEGGARVADRQALRLLGIDGAHFDALARRELAELDRRLAEYRQGRPLVPVEGRDVIVVDDGLATGVTAAAALLALRRRQPGRLVLAAPTCARDAAHRLKQVADEVVCVMSPADFVAVGQWYDEFDQTTDGEVLDLLERARTRAGEPR